MEIRQKREDTARKIIFIATTKEEKLHIKRLQEVLLMKRNGDWDSVSKELGLSKDNVMRSFDRVYSKNHNLVVDTLEKVIEERRKKLTSNE